MGAPKCLIVKFVNRDDPAAQSARIRSIVGPNVISKARQLFPDDTEAELASLYEVTLHESASVARVVESLARDARVEYVHEPEKREPM